MLPYVLALVIGFGSFAYYMAAFFFPEVHRKSDFLWSGVGFFYALVLWVCAGRITGAVLLSQIASVSLLGWLGWESLTLRRQLALPEAQTEISPQVQAKILGSGIFKWAKSLVVQPVTRVLNKQSGISTPLTTVPEPVSESTFPATEWAEPVSERVTEISEADQPPLDVSDVPATVVTEGIKDIPAETGIENISESANGETPETLPTEPVEEPSAQPTPPEPMGEFSPEEFPSETFGEDTPFTQTPLSETAKAEPTENQPKPRQGISGFFNNLLGKGKAKRTKQNEPETLSEDISTEVEPEISEWNPPEPPSNQSPSPSQSIDETVEVEATEVEVTLADETVAEMPTVDPTPLAETETTEPELPENPEVQPTADIAESIPEANHPTDSVPIDSENSSSLEPPNGEISPESPANPMGEAEPKTQPAQDSENPPPLS